MLVEKKTYCLYTADAKSKKYYRQAQAEADLAEFNQTWVFNRYQK